MLYSEPRELTQAKKFIDISKLDEAEKLIKDFEEKGGHTFHDIVLCGLLKCELLCERGLFKDVFKLGEKTYKKSLGLGKNLLSVDILLIMAMALLTLGQFDKAKKISKDGEEILKNFTQESSVEYRQREVCLVLLKGWHYWSEGNTDQAIKQFKLSISLRELLVIKDEHYVSLLIKYANLYYGISWALMSKGDYDRALKYSQRGITHSEESGNISGKGSLLFLMAFLHFHKGELDQSIMYGEQSLTIYKELNNKFSLARVLQILGASYQMKGELDHSIRLYEQSLELFKEFNNNFIMASIYNILSFCYRMKGELDHALECIEQSMALYGKLEALPALANSYDYLIQILIDRDDLEQAQISLSELKQLKNKLNHKEINLQYRYDKALFLKTSSRALNRGKAEEIFKRLVKEDPRYEARSRALLNLCELLLTDLQITNEVEVLEEIEPLITQLLDLSEKSHSFWILGESYLLQAKLALISLNLEEARKLLTEGQKIAEKYGLSLLAKKISNEHDKLLKQLTIWENLKESNAPLKERIELARLNDQMENMVRTRTIVEPEISDEEPIFILIVSEGGRPIFSQLFIKDQKFEEHLFGGFFSAINSFIGEMFSEGLDRAIFGEHTLLMNPLPPFILCYVFKGQSYSAQHRVDEFINKIQNDEAVWQTFNKFNQANKEIQLKDIPSLEPLINEIFVDKNNIINL